MAQEKMLQKFADELEFKAWELIRRIFGVDEYVEPEDLNDWLWDQGGQDELSRELGFEVIGSGLDRVVFDLGDYVGKVEFFGNGSNEREWNLWNHLPEEQQRWLARSYAVSQEDTALIMEKLHTVEEDTNEFRDLVFQIKNQELWMDGLIYDTAWYNWGYREGSLTPVVLDYGY